MARLSAIGASSFFIQKDSVAFRLRQKLERNFVCRTLKLEIRNYSLQTKIVLEIQITKTYNETLLTRLLEKHGYIVIYIGLATSAYEYKLLK